MKYQVELSFTQYSAATITLDADSLDNAHELAHELSPEDIADWRPINGDLQITGVAEAPAARLAPPTARHFEEALQHVLDYFMADEAADYLATSPREDREGHIYHDLRTVARWLACQTTT